MLVPVDVDIRRITYDTTSAAIIERIATKEAVHPLQSLDDLRARLGPDRRVFAAFHPLLPDEPLVFVHVALRSFIPSCMDDVLLETTTSNDDDDDDDDDDNVGGDSNNSHHRRRHQHPTNVGRAPTVAAFYSISSTQPGLRGVDLGQILIKQAVLHLQREFESIDTFVTLSPLPRFRKWLQSKLSHQQGTFRDDDLFSPHTMSQLQEALECNTDEQVLSTLSEMLQDPSKFLSTTSPVDGTTKDDISTTASSTTTTIDSILLSLAARYLVSEKQRRKPLDLVARFHLHNGAQLYRLQTKADQSRKGIHNSLGIMANYRYNLSDLHLNQIRYEQSDTIDVHPNVLDLLDGNTPKQNESTEESD